MLCFYFTKDVMAYRKQGQVTLIIEFNGVAKFQVTHKINLIHQALRYFY